MQYHDNINLLSTMKRFRDDRMQFGMNKCLNVTSRKGSLVKSKTIILDINTEVRENALKPMNM